MATKTDETLLNITGIPSKIDKDYLAFYFLKKCDGKEARILSYVEADNTAVMSIKQLDDEGEYIAIAMHSLFIL